MNDQVRLGLALLVGFALGATAIERLHAQAKVPGAYAIVDISEITNPDVFKQVGAKAGPAIAAGGGAFLARTDNVVALEGTAPKRVIIIGFDSVDKAKAWYASPAQKEVNAMTMQSAKGRFFVVEGLAK